MAGTGTAHLRDTETNEVVLRVEDLVVEYPSGQGDVVKAVSGISLDICAGETLGLVGESGCGKSTTGRAIIRLQQPTSGSVQFEGVELTELDTREMRTLRQRLQIIFQDPISSLNPRRTVRQIVAEGPDIFGRTVTDDEVTEVLTAVGLDPASAGRRPHEFSGGQCQRISIARALMLEPRMLICDEPVSALDVSVQAQILNLLEDMKERYGLTLLFIAHDLAVVKNISDRIAVMYLGKICEVTTPDALFAKPRHPYTTMLLASIPRSGLQLDPGKAPYADPPSPIDPPSGCRFRTRCPRATARCADEEPTIRELALGHFAACHHPTED